jgi:hypothetical protein
MSLPRPQALGLHQAALCHLFCSRRLTSEDQGDSMITMGVLSGLLPISYHLLKGLLGRTCTRGITRTKVFLRTRSYLALSCFAAFSMEATKSILGCGRYLQILSQTRLSTVKRDCFTFMSPGCLRISRKLHGAAKPRIRQYCGMVQLSFLRCHGGARF